MYINKVFILGNLTRDPELKSLPSGIKVCEMGVATNRYWKDRQTGERKSDVEYHNVVVFGTTAENVVKFLKKGDSVFVEGRLRTRSWEANDGSKRYRTEIVADNVQFGAKRGEGAVASGGSQAKEDKLDEGLETIDLDGLDVVDAEPDEIPF